MTQKFGRVFRLTIDPKDGKPVIVVTMPFTVRFWMKRDVMASLNHLSIDVFNLNQASRRRIYQDRFDLNQNVVNGVAMGARHVSFEIGYGNLNTSTKIFDGNIFSASSSREGTNIVTRIECMTGIYDVAASQTSITLNAGQSMTQVFKTLIGQFPNLTVGKISPQYDTFLLPSPITLDGNVWKAIVELSAERAYIDNNQVFILLENEALATIQIPSFNASTGILETPRREQGSLFISTLLEPSIQVGQLVNIASVIEPVYNGQYKVTGIQHQGTISAAVGGECRSQFILLAPSFFKYTAQNGYTQV